MFSIFAHIIKKLKSYKNYQHPFLDLQVVQASRSSNLNVGIVKIMLVSSACYGKQLRIFATVFTLN